MSGYRGIAIFFAFDLWSVDICQNRRGQTACNSSLPVAGRLQHSAVFVEGDKMKWLRSSETNEPHACRLGSAQS